MFTESTLGMYIIYILINYIICIYKILYILICVKYYYTYIAIFI